MTFTLFKPSEKDIPLTSQQIIEKEATSLAVFLAKNNQTKEFSPDNQDHLKLIEKCVKTIQEKQHVVKAIDKKAAAALTIGTAALVFSFIPFNWAVTIAGFSYGFYQLGLRDNAYKEYTQALEELKQCCNWALNDTDVNVVRENLKNPTVQTILPTLARLMNKQELKNVLNDEIENNLITETKIDFDKQNHTFEYKLYGYKQGSFKDVMNGILYAIQNVFHDAVEYCAPSHSSMSKA